MKSIKITLFIATLLIAFSSFTQAKTKESVYVFGISACFKDTTVYYTEVQLLDSVKLDKNKFLPQRSAYSNQLKHYLEGGTELKDRTCVIYFSKDKKQIDKQFLNVTQKYMNNKNMLLLPVDPNAFKFTTEK